VESIAISLFRSAWSAAPCPALVLVLRPMLCLHHASHLQLYLTLGRSPSADISVPCPQSAWSSCTYLYLCRRGAPSYPPSAQLSVTYRAPISNLIRFSPSASHLQCPSPPPHPHLRLSVPLIPKANHLLIHITSIVLQSDPYSLFRSFFSCPQPILNSNPLILIPLV
jgi:hypothetical protein